jgi:hypothetical protein
MVELRPTMLLPPAAQVCARPARVGKKVPYAVTTRASACMS